MATPTNASGNLVDEFEEAFQCCLNVLTKEETSPSTDKDEIRVDVDQTASRFIELARQMEAFFLQKRFLLSALKPELVIKEDINDLRLELARKDELLKRHHEKIAAWQNLLADLQGWAKSPAQGPAPSGMSNGNTVTPTAGLPAQPVPGGPQTPNQMVVPGMSNTLQQVQMQQVQAQQIQQMQQQQIQAQLQQQQMQAQLQQQQMQQQMQVSPQQAMFMQQQGAGRGAFPPQGPPGAVLQGPLAYLEKTTSNIGMTDGRR